MSENAITRRTALQQGAGGLLGASVLTAPVAVFGQEWPSRPLRILVGFPAGGSPDIAARLIGEKLSVAVRQPVIVEQVVGAGGIIASTGVAKGPADGYSLVMLTGAHAGTAATRKQLPYDPIRDFTFLTMVVAYPLVVVVPPDSPIATFRDLIAREKAAPGKITYASNAPGSIHHLLGEWVNIEAGTSMVAVPYRGASQSFVDLLGGRVDVMIETATSVIEPIKAGKVRAIAISSPERYPPGPGHSDHRRGLAWRRGDVVAGSCDRDRHSLRHCRSAR